jgi:glycogen synthase
MRLLLNSHRFHPDVGGIETVSMLLAAAFAREGHEVVVVTQSAGPDDAGLPYRVVRRPSPWVLWQLVRGAELVFHNHPSFQVLWPLLLLRRPWLVTQQTWLSRKGWVAYLKRWVLRFAHRLYISAAIGRNLGLPGTVVGNPYDEQTFRWPEHDQRNRDVVFVGRLVSDKGADLVVQALHRLKQRGRLVSLTLIGSGPEEPQLRAQVADLGLGAQVTFAGLQTGTALAGLLQTHRVMVVPSRWAEPFGIVALEGLACGCRMIVSDQGGLPEAIGEFGFTFPNGDADALAARLDEALSLPTVGVRPSPPMAAHLARFSTVSQTTAYLRIATGLVRPEKA